MTEPELKSETTVPTDDFATVAADSRTVSNQFENLQVAFPYIRSLDAEFYTLEPYRSNKLRKCKILVFLGALSNYPAFRELPAVQQNVIVRKIESGCVNETLRKAREDNIGCSWQTEEFVRRYSTIVREKAEALDYMENRWLVPRVVAGEINPFGVAALTEEQTNPDASKEMRERRARRLESKVERKRCSGYPCEACKNNGGWGFDAEGVWTYQGYGGWAYIQNVQTRGLDEAKVTRQTCANCGHTSEVER
jgi:hypothetical protein